MSTRNRYRSTSKFTNHYARTAWRLTEKAATLYEVQQALGHSDPKVTMRYSHLSSKSMQEAANSASLAIQRAMPKAVAIGQAAA